mmetsp:Transcript_36297/g.92760  ORF Transcript_36297/g.92760 Transcript_36297/m.92760 type:complete len:218 (+) Transcript_36297:185-838(+)
MALASLAATLPLASASRTHLAPAGRGGTPAFRATALPQRMTRAGRALCGAQRTRRPLLLRAEAEDASTTGAKDEPKTCKDAISLGLELYADKQFKKAIAMWQKSLELPGSGAMRMSGTVREFSCPSEGEENAALYNMACAYSQLGETQSAVTCLQGALENGFDDFQQLRKDPDLANIQGGELEAAIRKFENPGDKINAIFGRKRGKNSGTNKPWLIW